MVRRRILNPLIALLAIAIHVIIAFCWYIDIYAETSIVLEYLIPSIGIILSIILFILSSGGIQEKLTSEKMPWKSFILIFTGFMCIGLDIVVIILSIVYH